MNKLWDELIKEFSEVEFSRSDDFLWKVITYPIKCISSVFLFLHLLSKKTAKLNLLVYEYLDEFSFDLFYKCWKLKKRIKGKVNE